MRQPAHAAARGRGGHPPVPTTGAAKRLLAKAREELKKDPRQAAEKGWLAAVTAVRAMLRRAGCKEWRRAGRVGESLVDLEEARGMSSQTSDDLGVLAKTLHGSAFYKGDPDYLDVGTVELNFRTVERVIGDAEAFCRLHGRRRGDET